MNKEAERAAKRAADRATARAATPNPYLVRIEEKRREMAEIKAKNRAETTVAKWKRYRKPVSPSLTRLQHATNRLISDARDVRMARESLAQQFQNPVFRLRYMMNHMYHVGDQSENVIARIRDVRTTFEQVMANADPEELDAIFDGIIEDVIRFRQHMTELIVDRTGPIFTGPQVHEIRALLQLLADHSNGRIHPIDVELVHPDQSVGQERSAALLRRVSMNRVDRMVHLLEERYGQVDEPTVVQLCADYPEDQRVVEAYDAILQSAFDGSPFAPVPVAAVDGRYHALVDRLRDIGLPFDDDLLQRLLTNPRLSDDDIVERLLYQQFGKRKQRKQSCVRKRNKIFPSSK